MSYKDFKIVNLNFTNFSAFIGASKMISYGLHTIDIDDIQAVADVLQGQWLTQGPKIEKFEQNLAAYCGAKYAVCFNSGTAALHAAYFALGLKSDDIFITSPMTFAATANAGLYLEARPSFIDILPTGNIDPKLLPEKTSAKLIVPVHYAGNSADMQTISSWARARGLKIVEDACHSLGADYQDRKIGSCQYSDACVFSFHPVKPITTGEGGAVTTNDPEIYRQMLLFRSHGIRRTPEIQELEGPWAYEMVELGFNYRMTDLSAALGSSQLNKIDRFLERRRQIAKRYQMQLKFCSNLHLPNEIPIQNSGWHLFPILLANFDLKKKLYFTLKEAGILCQVHYKPVNSHPYYKNLGYAPSETPLSQNFYERELSLPIYPTLEDADIDRICILIREFLNDQQN
jgi:UDP-4-amino-4,6-dideoxy-N-acetyl-beta-L-altrosamine transaminase